MPYQYCPQCGQLLTNRILDGRERQQCPACEFIHYENPIPAAGVILLEQDSVLLVKRKYNPRAGAWGLPAGFVEFDETPLETAIRETREETGLIVRVIRLINVFGTCESADTRIVLIVYYAEKLSGDLCADDDAEEARYFPLTDLPENIAFASHRCALEQTIKMKEHGLLSADQERQE